MLLRELFDGGSDAGTLDTLRATLMDYLTPLAASRVESVPIQNVAKVLRGARTGIIVDRGLIMKLCDPNECKLVKSIDGDTVALQYPTDEMSAHSAEDEAKNKEKVADKAVMQAQKELNK
jgi:hypothetical protein